MLIEKNRAYRVRFNMLKGFCIHHNLEMNFDTKDELLKFLSNAIDNENITSIKDIQEIINYDLNDRSKK